jgi:hypothetical protein
MPKEVTPLVLDRKKGWAGLDLEMHNSFLHFSNKLNRCEYRDKNAEQ